MSAASIEVSNVEYSNLGYRCFFNTKQSTIRNLFKVGDVAYSQVYTAENQSIKYYKRMVLEVGVDNILLSDSDEVDENGVKLFVNGSGKPTKGDVICQYGSHTDTDRQYVIVTDVIGGGNQRMISELYSVNAKGYQYIFMGKEDGKSPRLQAGDSERGGIYVGVRENEDNSNKVDIWADTISFKSPTGFKDISDEIDKAKTDAEKAIKKAEDALSEIEKFPLRLEISTNGDGFLSVGEVMKVTVFVMKGFNDLSSEVEIWKVKRDSGNKQDDDVWNNAHRLDDTRSIDISYDDLGNNAMLSASTRFTFFANYQAEILEEDLII